MGLVVRTRAQEVVASPSLPVEALLGSLVYPGASLRVLRHEGIQVGPVCSQTFNGESNVIQRRSLDNTCFGVVADHPWHDLENDHAVGEMVDSILAGLL